LGEEKEDNKDIRIEREREGERDRVLSLRVKKNEVKIGLLPSRWI